MHLVQSLFGPDNGDASAAQLCLRAAVLFAFGIFCIRVAGRRIFSQYSPLDIIVAVVIGSNISRMMTGRAQLLGGGAATLFLAALHRLVAIAALRWPALGRLVKGQAVELIRDGAIREDRLKSLAISHSDLLEALRLESVDDPDKVALAVLERGGRISVVKKPERP